jgi:hypothetical protein
MGEKTVRSDTGTERIAAAIRGKGRARDGDFDIRIARDGTWYHQGTPINRLPLVKLFASVLRREPDGSHWLVTPVERGMIVVDDAPFVAIDVDRQPASGNAASSDALIFRTNLDETVVAGPDHPIRVEIDADTGEPAPYIEVRNGLEALINRATFYRLVELAEERDDGQGAVLGVWSRGCFFPLGPAGAGDRAS